MEVSLSKDELILLMILIRGRVRDGDEVELVKDYLEIYDKLDKIVEKKCSK